MQAGSQGGVPEGALFRLSLSDALGTEVSVATVDASTNGIGQQTPYRPLTGIVPNAAVARQAVFLLISLELGGTFTSAAPSRSTKFALATDPSLMARKLCDLQTRTPAPFGAGVRLCHWLDDAQGAGGFTTAVNSSTRSPVPPVQISKPAKTSVRNMFAVRPVLRVMASVMNAFRSNEKLGTAAPSFT